MRVAGRKRMRVRVLLLRRRGRRAGRKGGVRGRERLGHSQALPLLGRCHGGGLAQLGLSDLAGDGQVPYVSLLVVGWWLCEKRERANECVGVASEEERGKR